VKLLRVGAVGDERPAVMTVDGRLLDLSGLTGDIDGAFLASDGVSRVRAALEAGSLPVLETAGMRIGAPLARPGKAACIGLNYRDHAEETGAAIPDRPVVFMKDPGTVVGPHDSQYLVLEPGDVINTGTPAGVALGLPDHPYLRPGDVVELEIDGLGSQRRLFGAARP